MTNPSTSDSTESSDSSTTTNDRNGGIDWNRRAGPIFKYGLVVGFALIVLGGLSFNLSLANVFLEILVVCAGLSIILGAFGSTAKVTIPGQSMVLVGVAAIAVAFFALLMQEMNDRYVRVQIVGDVKGSQIDFVGDQNYLGSFIESERAFDFVIFGKEIGKPVLALYITLPDGAELPFECIDIDNIRPYLGSGKTIVWQFNNKKGMLMDVAKRKRIAELGPCQEDADPKTNTLSSDKRPEFSFNIPLISTAYAKSEIQTSPDTSVLIEQLESGTSYVRRDARSQLANKGLSVIQPLLFRLADEHLSYRGRLGVIVALTEMMRENKRFRAEIIDVIKEEDLVRLVAASTDDDRTIRIYASEFLFDLGDPRVINISLERFPLTSANGRYNLLLVIKGALPFAPEEQHAKVIDEISTLKDKDTPKTNDLIDSIIKLGK